MRKDDEKKSSLRSALDSYETVRSLIDYDSPIRNAIESVRKFEIPLDSTFTEVGRVTYNEERYKLRQDISKLEGDIAELTKKLSHEKKSSGEEVKKLQDMYESLYKKQQTKHIASRINRQAEIKLYEADSTFLDEFEDGRECKTVVVSIDIRRSTELMLKAKTPKMYSDFITTLSRKLSECIINNLGIFDKFTGDGILAFFPDFYSGEDAIVRALKASDECHEIFRNHYNEYRGSFNVFIKNIGLGIGVDYGKVTLVNTASELTVVGIPVVYACRFSGANAGETLLNHSAKDILEVKRDDKIKITETELDIKNEGTAIAYKVDIHKSAYSDLLEPTWNIEVNKINKKETSKQTNVEKEN